MKSILNILEIWRLRTASVVSSLLIVWLLTDEGGRRQFALVHAVDRAEGAHDATYSEAVEHLPRLDQRFACMAARKFTVCLQQRGKTGIFRSYRSANLPAFRIFVLCDKR